MICVGKIKKLKAELDRMINEKFPNGLCEPELVLLAVQYEELIKKRKFI